MAATLLASACPAPVVLGSQFWASAMNVSGAALPTGTAFTTGMTQVTAATLNKDFGLCELANRYGSGAYGVGYGLVVGTGSGLNAAVTKGHGVMDGVVEVSADTTITVPGSSSRVWIWLKQDGTLTYKNNDTSKPTGNCVLIGSCVTGVSSVSSVDTSGVVYAQQGLWWRDTGDTGAPSDSPDASLRLFTKTANGVYWWNGTFWVCLSGGYLSVGGSKSDADYTLSQTEGYCRSVKLAWTGWTTGRNVVVPTVSGMEWSFINSLGQAATIKTSGGTGISVASTKTARLLCDGTNIVRLTADV